MVQENPWTEDVCQFLRDNWKKVSRAQLANMIGDNFGIRVTRNAVIGKGVRLGLERTPNIRTIGQSTPRVRPPREPKPQTRTAPFQPKKTIEAEPFQAREVQVEPRCIPLIELTDETCKYECSGSSNAAEFTFCGHQTAPGVPYCPAHTRICFLQDNRRRARA